MPNIVNQTDIELLIQTDGIFALIHDKYGAPPNWSRPQGFVSLSRIILEQQVSLASANAHYLKLNAHLKEFTPAEILKLTDEEMRLCQISRQKAKYLRALSSAIIDRNIDLEQLENFDHIIIREQLTIIKGIGNWTADIYLMFCLQAKDIFPFGDIAIINTIKELSDARSKDEIRMLSEKWKPFRSLATFFFYGIIILKREIEKLFNLLKIN